MQVRLAKELYGNQIKEIYYTLPYNLIAFSLVDFDWLVHFSPCIILCIFIFIFLNISGITSWGAKYISN